MVKAYNTRRNSPLGLAYTCQYQPIQGIDKLQVQYAGQGSFRNEADNQRTYQGWADMPDKDGTQAYLFRGNGKWKKRLIISVKPAMCIRQ